jgi:hypothetical protein
MYGDPSARGTPWSVYIYCVPLPVSHSPILSLDRFGRAMSVFYLTNIIFIIIII